MGTKFSRRVEKCKPRLTEWPRKRRAGDSLIGLGDSNQCPCYSMASERHCDQCPEGPRESD